MPREPGRPQRELEKLDAALVPYGGARAVVMDCDAQGMVAREIVDRLEQLGGVRVSHNTVRNWLRKWQGETSGTREVGV